MNKVSDFEYLIIGAGPAGLQLGYFLEKANRNYLILEASDTAGSFFQKYPRHKQLISINKVYTGYDNTEINLRWDWNSLLSDSDEMLFKKYSRDYFPNTDDIVKYLGDFASYFQLKIKYNCQAIQITKDEKFLLIDNNGNSYSAPCLIIATGCAKPYIPSIPGIDLTDNYTNVSINPEDFINQRVLIIGKGNSGFETANNLVGTTSLIHIASPHPVSLAWKTKYVGNLRAVNNNLLDTYQLKSQNLILDATINKIHRFNDKFVVSVSYTHAYGEEEDLVYDRVIVCTGFQFDDSIFDESCKPELAINDRFPAQTSEWESTNIKDLYFIGILNHMRDYKKKQSGFIHGFRYNIRSLHHLLEQKYHHQDLPYQLIDSTPENLTEAIVKRVNTSSGLWQQTGFLCDLIVISAQGKVAQYYQELPIDYVHDSNLGQHEHYYIITLEFGLDIINANADTFAIERVHKDDIANSAQSPSLHPIIRRFSGSTLLHEHHIIEDIASEWCEDVHVQPLLKFLRHQLSNQIPLVTVGSIV
ncbi:FAD-dependent pyridine nucleotide-disulfide oxidoreductase [Tolypothrix tenuis PCC 7101]|uniref:FAD-dependent pyridine nucleotide-disulfide oxidoreductase n=1 Tax=Tolypothrix tenuis PCC 7101 TaxID=231146 RepID=A0A1Z4MRR7_9CYAN|nr:NAD(P)-binding domain-containing protein [Aulosira sp. FACHB-113]BAY96185.1 FAD-dependent pyridine nucleotide-disulfide oxidoreductase [Tolypothrix tenuis PCC 7101]BAZ73308.1 FAD-dependent pyridine nucleotide-disulfide oxidoreductase [Aulosira laxa NIES-50]